ncbi:MAG: DeoR family transcriptional regulator [Methylotenera sp.]|nr:DeoR family transcriptional regulator [Oligoflexia bacterium]
MKKARKNSISKRQSDASPEGESLASFCQRGDYRKVLNQTVDAPTQKLPAPQLQWIVAALCFVGRAEEAAALFQKLDPKTRNVRIACRFFLGISEIRLGRYAQGRQHLMFNLKELRSAPDAASIFYIHQGLGFYRFFSGRILQAVRLARKAHDAATEEGLLYGRVLATDLLGHAYVQSGEVALGIKTLVRAREHAKTLGNGPISSSIENSLIEARARHGLFPAQSFEALVKRLQKLSSQDTYTESSLLLEFSRQQLLRGKISDARKSLDRASQVIYSTQNRRHEILLNLRYAHAVHRAGGSAQGLTYIRAARNLINPEIDRGFEIELLGMELLLAGSLGIHAQVEKLKDLLLLRSRRYSSGVNANILRRSGLVAVGTQQNSRLGMDPLADILDLIVSDRERGIDLALESGYFGLLPEALGWAPSEKGVVVELRPGTLTLVSGGEVHHDAGLTPLTRKILMELARGPQSKKDLIEKVWKYRYHPLRHDSIIYPAINTLRKQMGPFAFWITSSEQGYVFEAGVHWIFPKILPAVPAPSVEKPRIHDGEASSGLNLRQLKILRHLTTHEKLDVRTLCRFFSVSEITASRDLSLLHRMKLVTRFGKGRSTEYVRTDRVQYLLR